MKLWRGIKLASKWRTGAISPEDFALAVYGPGFLKILLRECRSLHMQPVLAWGSLLGAVREGAFLTHDHDIDIAILQADQPAKNALRDRLLKLGFTVRLDDPVKLSVTHPLVPSLYLDVDVVYQRAAQVVITNLDKNIPAQAFHYVFPAEAFTPRRFIRFEGVASVPIPANPELFLSAVYGDWRKPESRGNHVYGPKNLLIEDRRPALEYLNAIGLTA